jgi:hypothetical protein
LRAIYTATVRLRERAVGSAAGAPNPLAFIGRYGVSRPGGIVAVVSHMNVGPFKLDRGSTILAVVL